MGSVYLDDDLHRRGKHVKQYQVIVNGQRSQVPLDYETALRVQRFLETDPDYTVEVVEYGQA